MAARLRRIEWPDFGMAEVPPVIPLEEYRRRMELVRSLLDEHNLTHLIVYGDREHFANIAWLTGYDPRFEEALCILSTDGPALLLVGNEGEGYLSVSPLVVSGELRTERYQEFSLLDQPRDASRDLHDIFAGEGLGSDSQVGCVGWKYFSSGPVVRRDLLDVPSFIVDALREVAAKGSVVNATDVFMHADYGLRSFCSVHDIAFFEYTNTLASEGVRRMIHGLVPGMRDFELMQLADYPGLPLGCHLVCVAKENADRGLSSPVGQVLGRGDPLAFNICYWGANICRAGWIAETADDLPVEARDYVDAFVGPYVDAIRDWLSALRIGTAGGELFRLLHERLPDDRFGVFLNPGHLIHLDEWLSSPVFRDSPIRLHSGMAMQIDIIPGSPVYFSTRMEDGVVLADDELRGELGRAYPDCAARCANRRNFMNGVLGFDLPENVLPLSNIAGLVPPFLLDPQGVVVP